MRVLIVKASALGDIVQALPVLDFLHQVSPGIEIDWAVEEQYSDILAGNPLVARLHLVRTGTWRKHPLSVWTRRDMLRLRDELQEQQYDLVFDIQGDLKSGFISWLTGATDRLGFAEDAVQERINLLFSTRKIPLRRHDSQNTDQCLRLVSVPFARDYQQMRLHADIFFSAEDNLAASVLLATLGDGLVFLFHCGCSWQTRLWSNERWIALGRALLGRCRDATILLSWGTTSEHTQATILAESIGSGARVLEHFSLKELTALLKKVDLVVGGDTGPVHIAAAVGTPTVSYYRATDGKRSGPKGPHHAIVQAPMVCSGCFRRKCRQDNECRDSITVDMIMKEIEAIHGRDVGDGL
jgi:heptosyltransferase I